MNTTLSNTIKKEYKHLKNCYLVIENETVVKSIIKFNDNFFMPKVYSLIFVENPSGKFVNKVENGKDYLYVTVEEINEGFYVPIEDIDILNECKESIKKEILEFLEIEWKGSEVSYEIVRTITGKSILEYGPCQDEFDEFVKKFGFYNSVEETISFKEFIEYAKCQRGWIDFLRKNDFIKIKEEEYYHSGDFIVSYDEKVYVIVFDGEFKILVVDNYEDKFWYRNSNSCKGSRKGNVMCISKKELEKIFEGKIKKIVRFNNVSAYVNNLIKAIKCKKKGE